MTEEPPAFSRDRLELSFWISCLKSDIKKILATRTKVFMDDDLLTMRFVDPVTSIADAAIVRQRHNEIIQTHQYIGTLANLKTVRYEWCQGGEWKHLSRHLAWTDKHMNPIDLSRLPLLTINDVWKILENHESDSGLPGSCMTMDDNLVLAASSKVSISAGVGPIALMRSVPDGSIYFPDDQLDRYKQAILEGAGNPVRIRYQSARVNDWQLCDRHVEAFAARMEVPGGSEIIRVVRLLERPRELNRVLELAR